MPHLSLLLLLRPNWSDTPLPSLFDTRTSNTFPNTRHLSICAVSTVTLIHVYFTELLQLTLPYSSLSNSLHYHSLALKVHHVSHPLYRLCHLPLTHLGHQATTHYTDHQNSLHSWIQEVFVTLFPFSLSITIIILLTEFNLTRSNLGDTSIHPMTLRPDSHARQLVPAREIFYHEAASDFLF